MGKLPFLGFFLKIFTFPLCRWSGPWPRAYSSHFNMILLKFQALPAPPPSPTMSPPSSAESPPQWGRVTENLRNCVPPSPPHKRVKSPPLRGGSMGGICPPHAISQWRGLLPVWGGGSPPLPGGLYNPNLKGLYRRKSIRKLSKNCFFAPFNQLYECPFRYTLGSLGRVANTKLQRTRILVQ